MLRFRRGASASWSCRPWNAVGQRGYLSTSLITGQRFFSASQHRANALSSDSQTTIQRSEENHDSSAQQDARPNILESSPTNWFTPNAGKVTEVQQEEKAIEPEHSSILANLSGSFTTLEEKLQKNDKPSNDSAKSTKSKKTKQRAKREPKTTLKKPQKGDIVSASSVKTISKRGVKTYPRPRHPRVPRLAHGLERVLFNPGPYKLQDQRTWVFNFDPYLAEITPVEEFDFDALKQFITSSQDTKLRAFAKDLGMKYCGSTSSLSGILSHLHFLLSNWRKPNFGMLSKNFHTDSENFTQITRSPAAVFARLKDGVYAIDSDKEFDSENILSMLGKSMEKLLTLPKEDYEKYLKTRSHQLTDEEKNADEPYQYTSYHNLLMRSQLDASNPKLPRQSFDLKTRAVVSIRMDVKDFEKGTGYEILHLNGKWQSYEREYYDMIRAAFLKYSLQVRMGQMDGIFVAYHNTQRIFGFQYIPLEEMDTALHGAHSRALGDEEYKASLAILNDLLGRATERFPNRSLHLHFETRPTNPPLMYFFAKPVEESEIAKSQSKGAASVESFKNDLLSARQEGTATTPDHGSDVESEQSPELEEDGTQMRPDEPAWNEEDNNHESTPDARSQSAWDDMMAKVNEIVQNESEGVESVRDSIHKVLEQSGFVQKGRESEIETHVDALVEALTSELSETSRESQEQESEHTEAASGRDEPRNSETASFEAVESAQDTAETETGQIKASLQDLILKVAREIDDKSDSISRFEQVLSETLAKSRLPERDGDEAEASTDAAEGVEATSEEAPATEKLSPTVKHQQDSKEPEVFGSYVSIQNLVDGKPVERLDHSHETEKTEVRYTVAELAPERAERIYRQLRGRRKKTFTDDGKRSEQWHLMWKGGLPLHTNKSEKFRAYATKQQENQQPTVVQPGVVGKQYTATTRSQGKNKAKKPTPKKVLEKSGEEDKTAENSPKETVTDAEAAETTDAERIETSEKASGDPTLEQDSPEGIEKKP